jgi:pimeloyl-ACP methyl ester carboxylesterase
MLARMTTWTEELVPIAGVAVRVRTLGRGAPVLVLHHDIGSPDVLPFDEALARRFTVWRPTHPGYDGTERPAWLRHVRDIAVMYRALLARRGLTGVSLVGLGFGGWIAAEMATMAPGDLGGLVLVGAAGLRPERGEILDQSIVSYLDYVRAGFHDPRTLERIYGVDPPTPMLERWDLNREMTFRIAWKPYMYSQTLPHLLDGVDAPALVVWGREDRIVPLECGEHYAKALPRARLTVVEEAGHRIDMERPDTLARLVTEFFTPGS